MNIGSLPFDAAPVQLAVDRESGIRYWPRCIAALQAEALFERLRDEVPWLSEQRPMYDRIVDVPRLQATIALADSTMIEPLETALETVRTLAPAPYTHIGLNFYRDGRDSVAMHHDRTHHLVEGAPIAILSLGAPRDMLIRRNGKGTRALRIALEPGSLLVMSHAAQSSHEHGIPKTTRPVGSRISCVFRVRKCLHDEWGVPGNVKTDVTKY